MPDGSVKLSRYHEAYTDPHKKGNDRHEIQNNFFSPNFLLTRQRPFR